MTFRSWLHRDSPQLLVTTAITLVLIACCVKQSAAQPVEWRTGADFVRQLQLPAGINWSETPLRQGLTNLSRSQGVAVFLDRRVDPDQRFSLNVAEVPLGVLFEALAERLQLGIAYVGPVVYVGPKSVARKLPTLAGLRADEQRALPIGVVRQLARARPLAWEHLATPREIVDQLADGINARIDSTEQIPHDLWPAVDLPPMSFADQMTLVLAGFDLTYRLAADGSSISLGPMPDDGVSVQRSYTVDSKGRLGIAKLAERFPDARISASGNSTVVAGPFELHDQIEQLLHRPVVTRPTNPNTKTVYELNVENKPVGGVLRALARQFKLELKIDQRAEAKLEEFVSFRVKDATREDLLKATLNPVGLDFRINGDVLEILPTSN